MTKRIVSGIFILTALGALGVILAGALTSGEQLIVRFLTAVIVAALGLYVISDLRLQADDDAAGMRSGAHPRLAGIDAPPNSTAAFMATVTGKGESPVATDPVEANQDDLAGDEDIEPTEVVVGATSSSTSEHDESAVVEDAGSPGAPPVPSLLASAPATLRSNDIPAPLSGGMPATITDLFARRASGGSGDRPWPSFGVDEPSAPATGNGSVVGDNFFDGRGDHHADDNSDEPGEADGAVVEADAGESPDDIHGAQTTDLPAINGFTYSGALETPVFEWPAPPQSASHPASSEEDGDRLAQAEDETTRTDVVDGASPGSENHDGATGDGGDQSLRSPFVAPSSTSAVDYADAPLAPIIDLRNAAGSSGAEIDEAITSGEVEVVAALIEQGMLSTEGPISDRDVRTMVYVAFTSNELKKLLAAGGTPDSPNPGIDLGPVELFKEGMVQPPKTLYPGPPVEAEARSQLG